VIRDENRTVFKERGITICLTARPEVVYERIRHETHRPLLQVPDPQGRIRELLTDRESFYRRADFVIDTSDKTVDDVINEIKEKVRYACC
jgi:shikimate kinase